MNPFPLQQELKILKPNLGKGLSWLAVLGVFGYDQLRERIGQLVHVPGFLVAVGFALLILATFLADLFLRRIYYNSQGVGVAMRFGGSATWYSFDELMQANLRRRQMPLGKPTRGRLVLQFHTGTVRIYLGLYDRKGIEEMTGFIRLRNRQDNSYGPAVSKEYAPPKSPRAPSYKPPKAPPRTGRSFPGPAPQPRPPSLKEQLEQWKHGQG